MLVAKLEIHNIRNLRHVDINPAPGINVFVGGNGQGKTSILESLLLVLGGSIIHGTLLKYLVRQGESFARIQASIDNDAQSDQVGLRLLQSANTGRFGRQYSENGIPKPASKKNMPTAVVFFGPQDTRLFSGSPARRRELLDTICTQSERQYKRSLHLYEKTLKQRNLLLSSVVANKIRLDRNLLAVYTDQLVRSGSYLWQVKQHLFDQIRPLFGSEISRLWLRTPDPHLSYHSQIKIKGNSSSDTIQQIYRAQLEETSRLELQKGRTLVGPHLDDLVATIQDAPCSEICSRGELRLLAIALKAAEKEVYRQAVGTTPLLLLDDIMSEMDSEHRSLIEDLASHQQTFITSTDDFFFSPALLQKSKYFMVTNGQVAAR